MAVKLNIPLPSKGLVVDRPAEYVDNRSASNILNMELNRNIIRKRYGSLAVGDSLNERIMRYFELQVGPLTRLFRVGLTGVESVNKTTGVWSSATTTPLTGGNDDLVSYAFPLLSGEKIVTFTNGIDAIRKCSITGDDADLGGSPPKARFMQAFGPYLVLAYITDSGTTYYSRVQWSDTGDPENWDPLTTNAGSSDLLEDPEDITGMGIFGNYLTVHKPNSIYMGQLVTTSDVFRFDRKTTGVGTAANGTIQNIPSGEQIFLASDGIHLFNGITAPLIDSPIQEELREEMNPQYIHLSQAIFVEELDEYWIAIPIGSETTPSTIYKYNWRTKQIFKDEHEDLTALGLFLNTNDLTWGDMTLPWGTSTSRWNSMTLGSLNPTVIYGDSSGISTKRATTTFNDNGTSIDGIFDTKDFTAEDLGITDIDTIMRWKGLEVWAKGNSVSIYYSTDSGSNWTLATTITLSSDYPDDDSPESVWFDVVKSKIRFRFRNNSSSSGFTLKKYQIEASQREARK